MKRQGDDHGDDAFMKEDDARKYFNRVTGSSPRRFGEFLKTLKKLDVKGRYLDVGAGPGVVTQMVARQHPHAEITGMDISPEMVKIANEVTGQEFKERINYVVGDACNNSTISDLGKYDLIFSTFTMHHWEDARIAIKNLYALLNTNGSIFIYDLKRVWWLYYIQSEKGFYKSIRASYTSKEIRGTLKELGISDYSVKAVFPFFIQNVIIRR